MPDARGKKKKTPTLPLLSGRQTEIDYVDSLLAADASFIPFLWGKPGAGKTALLNYFQARGIHESQKELTRIVSAPVYLEAPGEWEKSHLLLIDHAERLSPEALEKMLEALDLYRQKKGRGAVVSFATGVADDQREFILRKYRFLKPVEIKPLSRQETAPLLEQFARTKGLELSGEWVRIVIDAARDFFPAKALPGSALEILCLALAMSKNKSSLDESSFIGHLSFILGVDSGILARRPEQRLELFLENSVSHLDQIHLSQAARAMVNVMSPRLVSTGARRKPLGSFILAGMDTRPVHEFAKELAANFYGSTTCFLPLNLGGRGREETPEILARITHFLESKSGGVIAFSGVEQAALNMIEALERLLEDGSYQHGYSPKTDCGKAILIFSTEVGDSLVANANYVPSQLHKNVIRDVQIALPSCLWKRVDGIYIVDQG